MSSGAIDGPLRRVSVIFTATVVGVAAQFVPHPASAQGATDAVPPLIGFSVSGSVVAGRAVVDRDLARGWERVGDFGPSIGAALTAGYDLRRLGFALELESTNMRVGGRSGGNLAAAALVRMPSPWQPFGDWQSRLEAGCVRYGLGGAYVLPDKLPAGYLHDVPSPIADDPRLMLLGNGVRLGFSSDHALSFRTGIVVTVGADVVRFGSADLPTRRLDAQRAGMGRDAAAGGGVHGEAAPAAVTRTGGLSRCACFIRPACSRHCYGLLPLRMPPTPSF